MVFSASDFVSPEQYLTAERTALSKHEYYKGEVVAIAGATLTHSRIVVNLLTTIGKRIKETGYEIFLNDLRVSIPSKQSFTYPDISIVCDEPQMQDDRFDTLENPSVIFEVVSPSTEHNDRGRKFFSTCRYQP